MSRVHWYPGRPRGRVRVAAWALVALVLSGAPGLVLSADAWARCEDRVVADLEAAGLRDYGDVGAYTGATGAGAHEAVIKRCGYHPETVDRALCDGLFREVYPACREDGLEGMSMAASSWVLIFDPDGPLVARLRQLCAQPEPVGRAAFGRLVCKR